MNNLQQVCDISGRVLRSSMNVVTRYDPYQAQLANDERKRGCPKYNIAEDQLNFFQGKSDCLNYELYYRFKKYKTFSELIYSYINTSRNWENEKLCGNTKPAGRSIFIQFRVFPIFTSADMTVYQYEKNVLYFFYNIAQRTLTEEWWEIFRVDIELYQQGS